MSRVMLPVPLVRGSEGMCSEASIQMLLRYYNIPEPSQEEISKAINDYVWGAVPFLRNYFDTSEYLEYGAVDEIYWSIRMGHPVLVRIRPLEQDGGHTVVVVGYDHDKNVFIINDPAFSSPYYEIPKERFFQEWERANKGMIVIRGRKDTDGRPGKNNLAKLTVAEDKSWTFAFIFYKNKGYSDLEADRKAWADMQKDYPRLRAFEGAEPTTDGSDSMLDRNKMSPESRIPPLAPGQMQLLTREYERRIPKLYSNEEVPDPIVVGKFFTPDSNFTWYVTEGDWVDEDGLPIRETGKPAVDFFMFGLVKGMETELGYFSLSELMNAKGPFGLHVERDIHFVPRRLSEVRRDTGGSSVATKPVQETLTYIADAPGEVIAELERVFKENKLKYRIEGHYPEDKASIYVDPSYVLAAVDLWKKYMTEMGHMKKGPSDYREVGGDYPYCSMPMIGPKGERVSVFTDEEVKKYEKMGYKVLTLAGVPMPKAVPEDEQFVYLRDDSWNRGIYRGNKTGKLYADVEGMLYTMTAMGEPDCPIHVPTPGTNKKFGTYQGEKVRIEMEDQYGKVYIFIPSRQDSVWVPRDKVTFESDGAFAGPIQKAMRAEPGRFERETGFTPKQFAPAAFSHLGGRAVQPKTLKDLEAIGIKVNVPEVVRPASAGQAPSEAVQPGRCFLCLGKFAPGEKPIECEWCGREYHRACAKRVKICPQCGDKLPVDTDARPLHPAVPFEVGERVNTIDGVGIYKGVQTDPRTGDIINIFVEIKGEEVAFRHLDQDVWSMAPRGTERPHRR